MSNEISLAVNRVSKWYRRNNRRSVVSNQRHQRVQALKDVSMVGNAGECIGILGRNGSGKSTLLRVISQNEVPDVGEVRVASTPTLLNVSAALQPRLTGYQNIRIGLLAQGVPAENIPAIAEDIRQFADLKEALDRPMSTYSSGMAARLKFAISTAVPRDILLVDEALGTGDAAFNERANDRMQAFMSNAGTILYVSHSMESIRSLCTRAIWLNAGQVIADGDVDSVSYLYRQWINYIAYRNSSKATSLLERVERSYLPPSFDPVSR